MTTIDDLRRSMEERAGRASEGTGMPERALAGAQRIRRRRRVAATAAVACLVVVAGTVVPSVVSRLGTDGSAPTSVPPYRGPGQLTVRPAPDSTYRWSRGTDGTLQYMRPWAEDTGGCCADVLVYDPGTYDSRALERGERITVAGHPAFWGPTRVGTIPASVPSAGPRGASAAPPPNGRDVPTVGWQDPSGAWVTVVALRERGPSGDARTVLTEVAADVQLGAPQDVLVPMHFPTIPGDLPITAADVDVEPTTDAPRLAHLGFGGDREPSMNMMPPWHLNSDAPLQIRAWTADKAPWTELIDGPVNTTVAGRPARYHEQSDSVRVAPGGSALLVEIGSCGIQINVRDRNAITRADLEAMFVGATFDDCATTKTWTRPLR